MFVQLKQSCMDYRQPTIFSDAIAMFIGFAGLWAHSLTVNDYQGWFAIMILALVLHGAVLKLTRPLWSSSCHNPKSTFMHMIFRKFCGGEVKVLGVMLILNKVFTT